MNFQGLCATKIRFFENIFERDSFIIACSLYGTNPLDQKSGFMPSAISINRFARKLICLGLHCIKYLKYMSQSVIMTIQQIGTYSGYLRGPGSFFEDKNYD